MDAKAPKVMSVGGGSDAGILGRRWGFGGAALDVFDAALRSG
jgi:hypothetical protein